MSLTIAPHERPYLPRGVRLKRDHVRDQTVLLAPEKAVALDMIGEAILSRVNGVDSFDDIVTILPTPIMHPATRLRGMYKPFYKGCVPAFS